MNINDWIQNLNRRTSQPHARDTRTQNPSKSQISKTEERRLVSGKQQLNVGPSSQIFVESKRGKRLVIILITIAEVKIVAPKNTFIMTSSATGNLNTCTAGSGCWV